MMRRILAVVQKELSVSAATPTAWVFLILFLILSGFCAFVLGNIFASGQADISPFFDWLPYLFLLIVPALAMPMWAEERRTGVFELTCSFPASAGELAFGKYVAGMILLICALLLTFPIPLTAFLLGSPDAGAVFCGYLGALLLGSVYLSASAFCSAVSRSQTASFLYSLLLCGFFVFMGSPRLLSTVSEWVPEQILALIGSCSFLQNAQSFQKGLIDSSEVVYCLSLTFFFLTLNRCFLEYAASGSGNLTAPGAFRDAAARRAIRHLAGSILYILILTVGLNIIAGTWQYKFDISGDRAYSISKESASIAADPGSPVTLRFYASISNPAMPQPLKKYAERVKWILQEFTAASKGKIDLIFLDPEQDSPEEETAALDGIAPIQTSAGDRFYLGLSATRAENVAAVPFLSPHQENQLEYDIARIVLNAASEKKPVIGIISPFRVLGNKPDFKNFRGKPEQAAKVEPPWFSMSELARDYELKMLPENISEIPEGISALLIIAPSNTNPETLYAVDQYLMKGGRAAVFLDPRSFYAVLKARSDYSFLERTESDLKPLTDAWGVSSNTATMAADMLTAYRRTLPDRLVTNPMALYLTKDQISRKNPLFSRLNSIVLYFAGVLNVNPVDGVKHEILLTTSPQSQLVSALLGNRPELVIRNFRDSGIKYPLAVKITGKLPSAYPDGAPSRSAERKKHLAKGIAESEIFLFGDSDMLCNDVCVKAVPDAYGRKTYSRANDNTAMLQNVMEHLTGSRSLWAIRSRIPMSRPLTKINEMKAKAELKYKNRILDLEKEFREAQAKLDYLKKMEQIQGSMSPESRIEARNFRMKIDSAKRELKEMRANLKIDLERLDSWIKIINIILAPALIAILALIWSAVRLSKGKRS